MRKSGEQMQVADIKQKIPIDSDIAIMAESSLMRAKQFTVEQVVDLMRKRQGDKPQREFAAELGITQGYLSDIYRGNRQPGTEILEKLGLVRRTIYEQIAS